MNINNIINDITLINGDSKRMDCPECNGKKTFTVTNNMGSLVWNCYKASCNLSGGARVRLSVDDIKVIGSKKDTIVTDTFTLPEYIVPHNNRQNLMQFCTKWRLDADKHDLHYERIYNFYHTLGYP